MKTLKIIDEEFSVCQARSLPENTVAREDGWRAFRFLLDRLSMAIYPVMGSSISVKA